MQQEKQSLAQDLYFATDKTQQEIADILDVHRHTIRGWIKKNRWDEMKAAARQMPSLILQNIYNHISAVNDKIARRGIEEQCPTMDEVEKLRKLLTMTKSIQKQHTGSYMEAFQELRLFIFNRDSALAKELARHIDAYVRGTIGDREFMTRKRRRDNVLDATATLAKEELREEQRCATLSKCGTPCSQHEEIAPVTEKQEEECTNNVQFCNTTTPPTQPISDYVETRCAASLLAPDVQHSCHPGPAGGEHECINNVQFCIENDTSVSSPANPAKLFTVAANGEVTMTAEPGKCHNTGDSEKYHPAPAGGVTCAANEHEGQATSCIQHGSSPLGVGGVMALPPNMRPSPYIDGNTVWILNPDHLESRYDTYGNEWGPMKMGYTIRYYPDIDPAKAA